MYQVNIGSSILYYPGSDDAVIYDTELNEEVGLAGEFRFKVPSHNPVYSQVTSGALVTILKNGTEFWRGEIRNVKTDFAKVAEVYAVEDLAWLADEFMAPSKVTNQTYAQRFQAAITAYNANRSADRQFTAGSITNVTSSNTCNWTTEYEWSILDCLRNCICDAGEGGYIRVRRATSGGTVTRYIDIVKLSDYGVAASQPIEYGYNLLDYVEEMDEGNLTNVLTPYGDELETEVYTDYSSRLQGTTITNSDSVSVYGRHAKAVVFDNVSNVNSLNTLAQAYLTRYSQPQLTMEVQAVDLAEIEPVDAIKIGDSVRIIAEPFAIDQTLYLTQIKRDIQNIDKNTITMSGTVRRGKTLTSQINNTAEAVEEIPTKHNVLEAAKKNALSMLLDETQGGYVVYEYDSTNSYIVAINICNAKTIASSTKRWRWASTGFGYMYRANTSASWTGPTVAMTMNGEIVADFVTAGIMSANRMRGGTLALGGSSNGSYKNGSLNLYNSSDVLIGKWDSGGITLYDGNGTAAANIIGKWNTGGIDIDKGDINLGSGVFHVTNAGAVTASSMSITGGSIKIGSKASISDANDGVYIASDGIALGKSNTFKVTKAGALTAKNVDIDGGDINFSNGTFHVDANGKLTATNVDIDGGDINLGTGVFHVTNAGAVTASSMAITGGSIKIGSKASISDANDGVYIASDGIALGKSNTFKVTKAGALTAKNVDIDGGDINFSNGTFHVDANGKLTATNVDIDGGDLDLGSGVFHVDSSGILTAKSGKFGTNQEFEITGNGFRSLNGPTAAYGQNTSGTYIGKDGFCNNGSTSHVWISGGAITTDGLVYAKTLQAKNSLQIGAADNNASVQVIKNNTAYTGASGTISWATSQGGFALNIQNGIVVSIVTT